MVTGGDLVLGNLASREGLGVAWLFGVGRDDCVLSV